MSCENDQMEKKEEALLNEAQPEERES